MKFMKYLPWRIVTLLLLCFVFLFGVRRVWAEEIVTTQTAEEPSIVGGQEADIGEYPWQAMVQTSDNQGNSYLCGGSLISNHWVMTAGHCVYDEGTGGLLKVDLVLLGAHNIDNNSESGRQSFTGKQIILHPNFNPNSLNNDIALIELDGTAQSTGTVAPITLAASPSDDPLFAAGTSAVVAGWGETGVSSESSSVLMEVSLPMVQQSTCQSAYGGSLTNNMVCAGDEAGGKDSCRGDSGGPLIVADGNGVWKQVGIVSWGNYPCAQPGFYGVYTRVPNYYTWVIGNIGGNDPTATATATSTPQVTPTPQPALTPSPTATATATATSTPTATPTTSPTPFENLLENGDLENADGAPWKTSSLMGRTLITDTLPVAAASGNFVAWLGGENDEESRLWQTVQLPTVGPLYLVFDYAVTSNEQRCTRDFANIYLGQQRIQQSQLCNNTVTPNWQHRVLDVSDYAGQHLNLQFFAHNNLSAPSSFFVDSIKVTNVLTSGEVASRATSINDGNAGDPGSEVFQDNSSHLFLPLVAR